MSIKKIAVRQELTAERSIGWEAARRVGTHDGAAIERTTNRDASEKTAVRAD